MDISSYGAQWQREHKTLIQIRILVVPREGFEPTNPCGQRILSPPRLPFRHLGRPRKNTRHAQSGPGENRAGEENNLEATGGFEPPDRAFAEPRLNHLATSPSSTRPIRTAGNRTLSDDTKTGGLTARSLFVIIGAGDEIRTRDPLLGKEMLYR